MPSPPLEFGKFPVPEYFSMSNTSTTTVLHPILRDYVTGLAPTKVLDYGCGDGRFIEMLGSVPEVHALDKSRDALELAKKRVGHRLSRTYLDPKLLPPCYFDVVVCSLVLIMAESVADFQVMVQDLAATCKPLGHVIVAITHPCFRDRRFSDFEVPSWLGTPFDYFSEGQPFEVCLLDNEQNKSICFTDHHWTLSFTINAIADAKLSVCKLIETRDLMGHTRSNETAPPYLVIIAQKMSPKPVPLT